MTQANVQQLFEKYKLQLGLQFQFASWLKSWQSSELKNLNNDSLSCKALDNAALTFDVRNILKISSQGRKILDLYGNDTQLNDGSRAIIVELIVNYMVQNDIRMTTNVAQQIADEIIKVFPSELKVRHCIHCINLF